MSEPGLLATSGEESGHRTAWQTQTLSGAAMAIGASVLIGWWLDSEPLKRVVPNLVAMNPATAVGFLLAGLSLWMHTVARTWRGMRMAATGLACVVVVLGAGRLLAYFTPLSLGVDELLFANRLDTGGPVTTDGSVIPNRMAPNTAALFVLLGAALGLASWATRAAAIGRNVLALLTAMLAVVAVIGYLNGVTSLYRPTALIPIALHTAMGFLLLSLGVLTLGAGPYASGWAMVAGLTDATDRGNMPGLQRKITLGFGAALFLLSVIGIVSYASIRNFSMETGLNEHTQRVIAAIAEVGSVVKDAETGQRGYVITGQDRFLEPYNAAVAAIDARIQALRALTADQPAQQARVVLLTELIDEKLAFLREMIRAREVEGFASAQAHIATGRGKALMDAIRLALSDMHDAEARRLESRRDDTAHSAWITVCVITVGSLLAFALVGVSGWLIRRDMALRGRVEAELLKARDAADRANQSKSQFLANMSHEIRTPMTAIIGYADLLLDPQHTASDRLDYVNTIRRNGEHLLTVINDILDLSKIESGTPVIDLVECVPCRVLSDLASLMRVRAAEKGLALEVKSHGPVPQTVRTDPTRLRQILINLVGNAIKFTDQGWIRVTMALDDSPPHAPRLRFDVIDTGIGITARDVGRLFEPFMQADNTTTRRYSGTGLGLPISRRLARMLGGDIAVDSTPGRGSTFTLTIDPGPLEGVPRLADCREALAGVEPRQKPMPLTALRGHILLVDDGQDNRQLLSMYLRRAGADVTLADNGRVGCAKALAAMHANQPFDLILMDMQMPELDGYGATARLRTKGYTGPIIALTAHAMADDRDKCLNAGCTDYLTKPIRRENLLLAIAQHLKLPIDHASPPAIRADLDEDVEPFLQTYIDQLPRQVARLLALLEQGQLALLGEMIHKLRGSGGFYGLMPITDAAAPLDDLIRGGASIDHIQSHVHELVQVIRRVEGYNPANENLHPAGA